MPLSGQAVYTDVHDLNATPLFLGWTNIFTLGPCDHENYQT